jgi:hypothetical protein
MDFLFELLFQIIPGKFWIFVLAVLLVIGGVYVWRDGSVERGRYDMATAARAKPIRPRSGTKASAANAAPVLTTTMPLAWT